ncbi:MAG: hypothetical protein WD826_05675 [Actinomycetota bacterium]
MKRYIALAGIGIAVIALVASVPASAAGAAITQVGWWTQRPGATELESGGFELALAPNGPISQAALRIRVDAVQLTSAQLELTESEAAGAEFSAIDVCTTTESWSSANAGAWDDAPTPNCQQSIPMTRSLSQTWTADVSSLLTVGTVSLVLVPGSHPDTQGAPLPYRLVFSGATIEASAAVEPAPQPTPFTPSDDTPVSTPSDADVPQPVAPDPDTPVGADGTPPPTGAVVAIPSFVPDTEDEPGPSRPWSRLVVLIPLAAAIGVTTVVGRRALRDRGFTTSA